MIRDKLNEKQKWVVIAVCVLLFVLLSSPFMYKLTDKVAGYAGLHTMAMGQPTMAGIVFHGVVFGLLVRALMELPDADESTGM